VTANRRRARVLLAALGVLALLAAHLVVLRQLSSRFSLPVAIVLGAIALVVLIHLKRLRPLYERLRRRH
jgi:hypothetical protein